MYKSIKNSDSVIRLSDGAFIPADTENVDYRAYLAWLSESEENQPEAAQSFEELRQQKAAELQSAYEDSLTHGFTSEALGTIHSYASDEAAQRSLSETLLLLSTTGIPEVPYACQGPVDTRRKLKPHTLAQFTQVYADAAQFKIAQTQQLDGLLDQVEAATSQADLEALLWA